MGSETSHADRIGLAIQRLNHSVTLSVQSSKYEIFVFPFCFQSILFPIHPLMHSFDHRLTTVDFFPILRVYLETDEKIFDRKIDK